MKGNELVFFINDTTNKIVEKLHMKIGLSTCYDLGPKCMSLRLDVWVVLSLVNLEETSFSWKKGFFVV
jgi:hypothetical protein